MPHILNMRACMKEAIIKWPESAPFNFENFIYIYNEFCIGAIEPEVIIINYRQFADYWESIGTKVGARRAGMKIVNGVRLEGSLFRNAIILHDINLSDDEMKFIMHYDKEATENIKSLEGVK